MLKPPGEFGADICVGNSARFGVPLGYVSPKFFMKTSFNRNRVVHMLRSLLVQMPSSVKCQVD